VKPNANHIFLLSQEEQYLKLDYFVNKTVY